MIVVCGQIFQYTYHQQALEGKLSQVQSQCNILSSQVLLNDFNIASSMDNLNAEIDQLANVLEGRILVVDSSYKIVKDTYVIEQDKYMMSKDVYGVMSGTKGNHYEIQENNEWAKLIVPIQEASGESKNKNANSKVVRGVIICMVSIRDLTQTDDYMQAQGRLMYALFIFIAALISIFIAMALSRPLKQLNRNLEHVAEGHFNEEIEVIGTTETRDLSTTFNTILSKIQILENSRQEFVSNVSHELKTPITSMKVLADSLIAQEEVPNEMYREFMVDIAEEIERENKIINDLLTLVRLDKQSKDLNIETVSINAMLELLLKRIQPIAQKREIEIVFESQREVMAEVDEVKLSLAFSNLIENAVKYNVDRGSVGVKLDADHRFLYVRVEDTGVGIPEDCREQVFERFYRVDKARSRETGGTGLGLAITRNAILMHKGAINIYSEPGEGTTFVVRIPLVYIR